MLNLLPWGALILLRRVISHRFNFHILHQMKIFLKKVQLYFIKGIAPIIFLRKIIEGGADRSYGVHVAEMAGLPKSVVMRAHDLLKTLSKSERSKLEASESMPIIEQMDIFSNNNDKLQIELNDLDINTMTPLDALAKLDELKKRHGV